MAGRSVMKALGEALLDPTPRGFVHAGVEFLGDVSTDWEQAKSEMLRARAMLVAKLGRMGRSNREYTLVAFSLGCELTAQALLMRGGAIPKLRAVAFVGAAMPCERYERLLECEVLRDTKILHVYSEHDSVLRFLYPAVESWTGAAGSAPVNISGVEDVQMESGHLSYPLIAAELLTEIERAAQAA
jgi:predicted alpha/beta hydrolase family esterase